MMIHKNKCLEIGLPAPRESDTQKGYVKRLLTSGHKVNTRLCRFIGIGNLHSITSSLKNKGTPMIVDHGLAMCPETREVPPYPVDIIYMTEDQIKEHQKVKPEPATSQ